MEKQIKIFWVAGFFLPSINATVFRVSKRNQFYFQMDFDDSQKPDEKLTGEEKGDDFIGFGTGQNTAGKLIIECPDILQTAVVSNYRVSYGKV